MCDPCVEVIQVVLVVVAVFDSPCAAQTFFRSNSVSRQRDMRACGLSLQGLSTMGSLVKAWLAKETKSMCALQFSILGGI